MTDRGARPSRPPSVTAPPPLPDGAPVRYGVGAIEQLPEVVADAGAEHVLLVRGRRSFEASGAARMLPDLRAVATISQWSGFAANPDVEDLQRGLAFMAEAGPDLVLGVGGGSTMDVAKLLCAFDGIDDPEALRAAVRSHDPVRERRSGLVLVPTTSGSGSEATHFAVVYIGELKFSVGGPALRPDTAILDPALSLSASAHQRATSGIDAVCQAIESLWAAGATADSRRFAEAALGHLLPTIEAFVREAVPDSAVRMALGSHLAGRAIDISKTTAAHALSYALTKRHGVSHGHAVALTLGPFIRAHADATTDSLQPGVDPGEHAAAMAQVIAHLGAEDGAGATAAFTSLMERIGLPSGLADVGVESSARCGELADAVNAERLGNNPVVFTRTGLRDLLLDALGPVGEDRGGAASVP